MAARIDINNPGKSPTWSGITSAPLLAGRPAIRRSTGTPFRPGGAHQLAQPATTPTPDSPSIHTLCAQLLAPELAGVRDVMLAEHLGRAADEAVALAWSTPFPLLLLPTLLQEKCAAARHYCRAQARVRRCSQRILLASGLTPACRHINHSNRPILHQSMTEPSSSE